ncbi:hypothetical protein [Chromobacterium haemolyticum]|uniref:hypothetical protein n=1 Tax=Chromobacterium TaxID=535 RepID=UPI004056D896
MPLLIEGICMKSFVIAWSGVFLVWLLIFVVVARENGEKVAYAFKAALVVVGVLMGVGLVGAALGTMW